MPLRPFLLAALVLLAAAAPASARYACAVKSTPDGFVALREGPSAGRPMLARMRPREFVGLLHPGKDDIVRSGDWLYVLWYPGVRRTADSMPDVEGRKARAGWVRDSLVDCFE